jgi:hypothetical protein
MRGISGRRGLDEFKSWQRNTRIAEYHRALSIPWPRCKAPPADTPKSMRNAISDAIGKLTCEDAKGDLARWQNAQQQALAVYQQIADDQLVSETDRQEARRNVAALSGDQSR